ncbi:MAG: M16 family metallopeptidase [Candidatus Dormibacteria bacterium]
MPSSEMVASGHTLEVLDSGARLITAPMPARQSVSVALMFGVGSRHEAAEMAGISHFVEHMVFKGSDLYPGSKEVAEAIEGIGGELNAATDKEATMYWARVPGDRLKEAVSVLCDMVLHPLMKEEEVDREREVIIEELRMYRDSPGDHVHTVFEEMLWPDHALGVDIAGTEENLPAVNGNRMREHLRDHYNAQNLVAVIAGNVEHDAAMEAAAPFMAQWPGGTRSRFAAAVPLGPEPRVQLISRPTEQVNLVLGTRCIDYFHPDRYALDMMNTVLGEGMSSRLFLEVREKHGLCYDVHSWAGKMADTGSAGVYIGTDPSRTEEALKAVMHELHRMAEETVGPQELEKARAYLKGRMVLRLESTGAVSTWLGGQELLTNRIIPMEETLAGLDQVTAEDVTRLARETYAAQPMQLAAIGPIKNEARLAELIHWS